MKILVAIPCMGTLPVAFVQSLIRLNHSEADINVRFLSGSLVYDARNLISLEAIRDGYDYVLWLDSDMTFEPDILHRLLADTSMMSHRPVNMITGVYVKRTMPTLPVLYDVIEPPEKGKRNIHEYINYPVDSLFPVEGCGFGCVLTAVPLLKKVWDAYGPAFNPLPWASEDISFCYRVNQLNESIYCDSKVQCGHIGTFLYTPQLLKRGDNT